MNQDLISIVVPIYNTEKYLKRCIESILNQTYQNLEVILVNDGSLDKSGQICNEYAKRDKRIKVIHKENTGSAESRNIGIKYATGKLIGFVDSDDYIDKNMYEMLYKDLKKHDAEIAICNIQMVNEKFSKLKENKEEPIRILDKKEALYSLIEDDIKSYSCNKLYKIELFTGIEYPKRKNMEDLAIMYKLFEKVNKILIDKNVNYYYVQRNNSIIHTFDNLLIEDGIVSINERYDNLINKYSELKKVLIINKLYLISYFYKIFYGLGKQEKDLDKILNQEYGFYKKYYRKYKKGFRMHIRKNAQRVVRIQLETQLLYFSKRIFRMYCFCFRIVKELKSKKWNIGENK